MFLVNNMVFIFIVDNCVYVWDLNNVDFEIIYVNEIFLNVIRLVKCVYGRYKIVCFGFNGDDVKIVDSGFGYICNNLCDNDDVG